MSIILDTSNTNASKTNILKGTICLDYAFCGMFKLQRNNKSKSLYSSNFPLFSSNQKI